MNKFNLGRVVITRNANEVLDALSVQASLFRHQNCDWGDCCENDWKTNDNAVLNNDRLLSVYKTSDDVKFWIITESDRSYTTILLPEDY